MTKKIPAKEKVHIKVIEKLGKFLAQGNHVHKNFDFSVWNDNTESILIKRNECGTNGCAIGNLPHLFPKNFEWDGDDVRQIGGEVFGKKLGKSATFGTSDFLGLPDKLFEFLFIPEDICDEEIPNNGLSNKATVKQVGKHLLNFVKEFKEGKWDGYFFMQ